MSYDLAVWSTERAIGRGEAAVVFGKLREEADPGDWLVPTPAIEAFLKELTAVYPQGNDEAAEDREKSPWTAPLVSGPSWVVMSIEWSWAETMGRVLFQLSRKHGLALYDAATSLIYLPDKNVEVSGLSLVCPWLHGTMPASRELLADLLEFLPERDDPFLIVGEAEQTYMQTIWTREGFLLEYREGDAEHHFQAEKPLPTGDVARALYDYLKRGQEWRNLFPFKPLHI